MGVQDCLFLWQRTNVIIERHLTNIVCLFIWILLLDWIWVFLLLAGDFAWVADESIWSSPLPTEKADLALSLVGVISWVATIEVPLEFEFDGWLLTFIHVITYL